MNVNCLEQLFSESKSTPRLKAQQWFRLPKSIKEQNQLSGASTFSKDFCYYETKLEMSAEQIDSPATRIKMVSEILQADTELIYMEGYVTPEIWDELTEDPILGRIAPNVAVGRAIIAQIRQLEDDTVLSRIIPAHIQSYKPKDKTYSSGAVRAWMNILRDELQTRSPRSILKKDEMDQTTGA